MQIADRSAEEITQIAKANNYPIDVLYFADSMGSLNLSQLEEIIKLLKKVGKVNLVFILMTI